MSVTATEGVCGSTGEVVVDHAPRLPFEIVLDGIDPVNCTSPTSGALRVVTNVPDGAFLYSINNGPGQTNGTFTGLVAGEYVIIVRPTGSDLPCATRSASYVVPPAIDQVNVKTVDAFATTCSGIDDGSALVRTNGGELTFQLAGGSGPSQTDSLFTDLPAGPYTVIVTNTLGCTGQREFVVPSGRGPVVDDLVVTPATCARSADGRVVLPDGGDDYAVDGVAQGSRTVSGLTAGTYTYTITTTLGCRYEGEFEIGSGNRSFVIGAVETVTSSCFAASDGELRISGLEGAVYELDGAPITTPYTGTELSAGAYSLNVTNSEGCVVDTSIVVNAGTGPTLDLGDDLRIRFGDTVLTVAPFYGGPNAHR